ncbi:type IV secretion protein Rhs [Xenorhabdus sp. PB62.4]|nr:type IV secretion protein Rhs [Xenorhabdus sp. PB62.4]
MSRVIDKINQLLDRSGLVFTLITENLPEQTTERLRIHAGTGNFGMKGAILTIREY